MFLINLLKIFSDRIHPERRGKKGHVVVHEISIFYRISLFYMVILYRGERKQQSLWRRIGRRGRGHCQCNNPGVMIRLGGKHEQVFQSLSGSPFPSSHLWILLLAFSQLLPPHLPAFLCKPRHTLLSQPYFLIINQLIQNQISERKIHVSYIPKGTNQVSWREKQWKLKKFVWSLGQNKHKSGQ